MLNLKWIVGLVSAMAIGIVSYDLFVEGGPETVKQETNSNTVADPHEVLKYCLTLSDECWYETRLLGSITYGKSRASKSDQSECLLRHAQMMSDITFCDAISDNNTLENCSARDMANHPESWLTRGSNFSLSVNDICFSEIAFLNEDRNVCDKINNETEKKICNQITATELQGSALAKNLNTFGGTGITNRITALVTAAAVSANVSDNASVLLDRNEKKAAAIKSCQSIPDNICIDEINEGQIIDKCMGGVSVAYDDVSLCFSIPRTESTCSTHKTNYWRDRCLKWNRYLVDIDLRPGLCAQMEHPEYRKECYDSLDPR